jgi:hypothetical protein
MNKNRWIIALVVLLLASLACSVISGGDKAPAAEAAPDSGSAPEPTAPPADGGAKVEATPTVVEKAPDSYDTEFPLPSEVSNFMSTGNEGINFQTTMSLEEAVTFYRDAFKAAGYKEREINTVVDDAVFSMVFDGHANGKAIVIQGVDLGESTNINIRFEDV